MLRLQILLDQVFAPGEPLEQLDPDAALDAGGVLIGDAAQREVM